MTESRRLLQHFIAAIAYRTQKALREAPAGFADFRAGPNVRTPHELLWHMTHAGQLALLRRLVGSPIPPEDFISADVRTDRVGPDQPPPASPDAGWSPEQPPMPVRSGP